MSNKISACLVVYNEEKNIKTCLESIKDVVNEIIVVHDGECQDNTLAICREYTDKVYVRDHIGQAEPHRPFSFAQTRGSWILQIDADEFLSEELKKEIVNLVEDSNVDAYEFLWPLWDSRKYITKKWPYKRCLFRKENLSFLGVPHFVACINGEIKKSNFILGHRPIYNNFTWQAFKTKYLKWAKIQAGFYLRDFKDISKFNWDYNGWSLKIKLRVKFPVILIPMDFLTVFLSSFLSGGYKEGVIGLKVALMQGAYRVIVNYYIFRTKQYVLSLSLGV